MNPFKSDQKGVLHVYANNGPVTGEGGPKKPGDLLFESDAFSLRAGYNMVTVSDLRVRVPEEITSVTWALEFSGLSNIGEVGLLLHDEPDKGASAGTFWLNAGTKAAPDWQLQTPANGRGNFSARVAAQTPPPLSLAVSSVVYEIGEPIEVTFSNGPGNPKDWVGIYGPEMIPGSAAAPAWAFVNGSKSAGQGLTDGTLVFDAVLQSGDYVARFFEDDGYNQLASENFSIAEPPGVTVGSEAYLSGETITVHFANGPGNPKDWIAVYRPDMIPAKVPSLLWAFVNGTQIAGEGLVSGSVSFAAGLPAGEYVARYLENDGYNQLAEASFNVKDNSAPVITLKGEQSVTIKVGENYEDAGATANDDVDGDITQSIEITGMIITGAPGVYTLTFNVKDNSGNAATPVVRTVRVVDEVAPVITLKGEQSVTIKVGENYEDAGATANDDVDGDITQSIEITGLIIKGTPGIYTLTFKVKDKSGNAAAPVVRTVRVRVVDEVAPVITLKGEQSVTIKVGENYEDAGATANDDVDGDITQSIEITGMIITGTPGVYTLTFKVKDKSGNAAAPVVRTVRVRVVDEVAPVITLKGEQSVTIKVGENYEDAGATANDDVDGDITQSIEITGLIIKGTPGIYTLTFKVKDKSGNAAAPVVRTIKVVKLGPPMLTISRNANGTVTVTFDGKLQTAVGVNAPWQVVDSESPAVLPVEKSAAFFRSMR